MHVSYTLWEGIFPNSLGVLSTRKNVARRVSCFAPGQVMHVQLHAGREYSDLIHGARRARPEELDAARRVPWPLLHHERGPSVPADTVHRSVRR